jgi:hypothetical protein
MLDLAVSRGEVSVSLRIRDRSLTPLASAYVADFLAVVEDMTLAMSGVNDFHLLDDDRRIIEMKYQKTALGTSRRPDVICHIHVEIYFGNPSD